MAAVVDAIRAPDEDHEFREIPSVKRHDPRPSCGFAPRRPVRDPEQIARRVERAGYSRDESLLLALAVHATVVSPQDLDVDWIASVAARVGDPELIRDAAGVVFAFNTINRIADARRVQLEYRLFRQWRPIRGWVERRFASLAGLAYDLSFTHRPRHSSSELLERLETLFERMGASDVPQVFHWLSASPVVLEGVLEMFETNLTSAAIHTDLLKEAAAIAASSRAVAGSGLASAIDHWLSRGPALHSTKLTPGAAPPGAAGDSPLASACRRYSWRVANAAYTISDEQIRELASLGLPDAELLDLALAGAVFSALAIVEAIGLAVAPPPVAARNTLPAMRTPEIQIQSA